MAEWTLEGQTPRIIAGGGSGAAQELDKQRLGAALKALGDVAHDRYRRSLNLVAQAEVLRKRSFPRMLVHVVRQFAGVLPHVEVFEALDCCHWFVWWLKVEGWKVEGWKVEGWRLKGER